MLTRSIALAAMLGALGCRTNPNYCEGAPNNECGTTPVDGVVVDTPDPPDDMPVAPDGTPKFRPSAVHFEHLPDDYLTTNALTGVGNSPKGTFSAWMRFSTDVVEQKILVASAFNVSGGITRTSTGKLRFWMPDCIAVTKLDMTTQNNVTAASGWVHILASWDTSAGRADIYVNDTRDVAAGASVNNGSICYDAGKWGFGGLTSGTLDADVADVYAALGTYIDFNIAANRRLFSDVMDDPIDIGPACQNPTGTAPTICLRGDPTTFHVNKGTGGGMDQQGDGLTVSTTNPAD